MQVHHLLERILDEYIVAAGLQSGQPLFQSVNSVGTAFTRYSTYQKVQETFYGQALLPAKDAFNFHLVDQDEKPFQLSQLRGKLVLFSFGFTHCPDVLSDNAQRFSKSLSGSSGQGLK